MRCGLRHCRFERERGGCEMNRKKVVFVSKVVGDCIY